MNASSASPPVPRVLAVVCLPCFKTPRPLAGSLRTCSARMLTNADLERVLIRPWLCASFDFSEDSDLRGS